MDERPWIGARAMCAARRAGIGADGIASLRMEANGVFGGMPVDEDRRELER